MAISLKACLVGYIQYVLGQIPGCQTWLIWSYTGRYPGIYPNTRIYTQIPGYVPKYPRTYPKTRKYTPTIHVLAIFVIVSTWYQTKKIPWWRRQSLARNRPYHGLFRLSDDTGSGLVTMDALKHTLNMLGAKVTPDEAQMVADRLAARTDGLVDYEGLYRLLLASPPPPVSE